MRLRRIFPSLALLLACAIALPPAARAQATPPGRENAALGYWMAFALMQDVPYDTQLAALLERVAAGQAPWDEARLGPLVERNLAALGTMHRATSLPVCNWGLEYDLGPEAPIAHLAKARALGRLNVLYGMRLAAQRDPDAAVTAWLHGIRFAQHMAQGSSLIGLLTAKAVLESHLRALRGAVEAGQLDPASLRRVAAAVEQMPAYGFEWSRGVRLEGATGVVALQQLRRAPDPRRTYESWFGEPAPAPLELPNEADIARFAEAMGNTAAAFERPHGEAAERLAAAQEKIARLHAIVQRIFPAMQRVNDARRDLAEARTELLAAIGRRLGKSR